jgi:hypothetical protein
MMRVLNKSLKVLLLGTTLMTSAKAADLTLTIDAYTALADKIAVGTAESDKAVEISGVSGSGLLKGSMGTVAASSEAYVWSDSTTAPTSIKVLALLGGKWCTFENTSLAEISATGQVHLAQTKSDGVVDTTNKLTINLTKTSGANISSLALVTFLKANLITANKSFGVGALKTLSVTPPTGWTATALFQLAAGNNLASAAVAATLDPIAFTLTVPVTPAAAGTAVNYSVSLSDISAYNVALNNDYSDDVELISGSKTIALKPGKIGNHGTSIMAGLVADANALTRRRLKTAAPYTYQTLSGAVDYVNSQLATTPGNALTDTLGETVAVILEKIGTGATVVQTGIQGVLTDIGASTMLEMVLDKARSYIVNDLFTVVDCDDLADDTGKYGLVAYKNTVSAVNGWQAKGSKVIVNGTVGGAVKEFTCDVTNVEVFKDDAETSSLKKVLMFKSANNDVFWIKAFDAIAGLDTSTFPGSNSFKDDFLALLIADKFSGVTSISAKTFAQLATAAAS